MHGFKAHVGADAATALVERVAVTPANVNDGRAGPDALPDDPGEVFADRAYRGSHFGDAVRAKGGSPRVVVTAMWATTSRRCWPGWMPGTRRSIACARIEKIFGTWKRCYGLRRMGWRGLARAALLTARGSGDVGTRLPGGSKRLFSASARAGPRYSTSAPC